MKSFNFSPSALGSWFRSQLGFYYSYLSYETPEPVIQSYGISGILTHSSAELYVKNKDVNKTTEFFISEWAKRKLDTLGGFNGKPLSKMIYHQALLHAIYLIDNVYEILDTELKIELPFVGTTKKKGYIDVVAKLKETGEKIIVDWKTSSSMDKTSTFRIQVLFYSNLYWCKTGELIKKARIEYLKLKTFSEYEFTEDEIKNFDKNVLMPVWADIQKKGENCRNYDLGDYKFPFNSFKCLCHNEFLIRQNSGGIQVYRKNNKLVFKNGLTEHLKSFLNHYFSYEIDGKEFSQAYKNKVWDGRKTFFKKNSLPFAFVWKVDELIKVYNNKFNTTFWLDFTDFRNKDVVRMIYKTKFKDSDIKLRPYQEEAVKTMLSRKYGIIFGGTGMGKTVLTADFIKKINRRTLVLVNRIELIRQTADEFENYLGVKVGRMAEGNLDIDKQITIGGIQTIAAILKRKNKTSKELKMYLYNVTATIADEAQGTKDSGMYKQISDELVNLEYMIGLSGSPFRNGPDSLEMNALVGFVIYKKTTKELEDEGYLCPTKTYFLGTPQNKDQYETPEYHENYQSFITKNTLRNETIRDIVNKYKDKKKIMILVKSIEHGELLEKIIPSSFFLYGSTPKKKRKDMYEEFKHTNGLIMISMVSIFGQGIDVPDLDILINASAFGSDISSIQTIGRTKRKYPGKIFGYYIDFNDLGIFRLMAKKRMKMLESFDNPVDKSLHITEWEKMEIV